jgi:hypothetical protein
MALRKAFLTAAVLLAGATPAFAVESGLSPYLKGAAGFMSGFVPPEEGLYLSNTYYYFNGKAGADVRNGRVELGVGTSLNVDLIQGTYVTDWHLFGGTYAFGGTFDYLWAGVDADIVGPLGNEFHFHDDTANFSDSIITPIVLGWHSGYFNWNTGVSVYIPTGVYHLHELSPGKNVVGVMPQFAITYFNPKSGLDVSATIVYVTMGENDATHYQSGDMLHIDWAAGLRFGAGLQWEAGVVGNVVQQVGADSGAGALLGPNKAQSLGIGPGISYSTKIGNQPLSFAAKWEHDIDAHNTFEGDVVTVNLSTSF